MDLQAAFLSEISAGACARITVQDTAVPGVTYFAFAPFFTLHTAAAWTCVKVTQTTVGTVTTTVTKAAPANSIPGVDGAGLAALVYA